jgi:hypothetical protein
VALVSPTQATVTCPVIVSGDALSDERGVAVYSGRTWQAGVASFCGLLAAGDGGTTSPLPAARCAAG